MEGNVALSENTSDLVDKLLLPPVGVRVFFRHLFSLLRIISFLSLTHNFILKCFFLVFAGFPGFALGIFFLHERYHVWEGHFKVIELD
jgi:hypothetical protein